MLASPIFRAVLNFVGCAASAFNPVICAGIEQTLSFAGALAQGGSLGDALKAAAITTASVAIFNQVGMFLETATAGLDAVSAIALETTTHGVVGGALSAAQGGNFLEGFASSAIGKAFGRLATGGPFGRAGDGNHAGLALRTAVAAAGGCAGALLGGGKCGNGAVTASLAHLFNAEGPRNYLPHQLSKGHHWFPEGKWPKDLSKEARAVFDKRGIGTSGALPVDFNKFDASHRSYNNGVGKLFHYFIGQKSIDPSRMTSRQATQFLGKIWTSRVPAIARYRAHINVGRRIYLYLGGNGKQTMRSLIFRPFPRAAD